MLRALAKDPAERFADAEQFIAALEHVRHGLPAGADAPRRPRAQRARGRPPPPPLLAARRSPSEASAQDGGPEEDATRRRRRWWWIGGAVLLALVAAGVALALLAPGRQAPGHRARRHRDRTEALAAAALKAQGLTPVPVQAASTKVAVGLRDQREPSRPGPWCSGAPAWASSSPPAPALPECPK